MFFTIGNGQTRRLVEGKVYRPQMTFAFGCIDVVLHEEFTHGVNQVLLVVVKPLVSHQHGYGSLLGGCAGLEEFCTMPARDNGVSRPMDEKGWCLHRFHALDVLEPLFHNHSREAPKQGLYSGFQASEWCY